MGIETITPDRHELAKGDVPTHLTYKPEKQKKTCSTKRAIVGHLDRERWGRGEGKRERGGGREVVHEHINCQLYRY